MADTYTMQHDVMHSLFKTGIMNPLFKKNENMETILNIILGELQSYTIEHIVHLLLIENKYRELVVGDYVKVKPYEYHIGKEFETDVLKDLGLMTDDNRVYGKVIGDTSWASNDKFNPYHSQLKLDLLYHDEDKKIKFVEHSINPMALERVTKGAIKYFKHKPIKTTTDAKILNPIS
jgi:hypothetical protein